MARNQSMLFKGIYEFEDPSGTLIAAKSPTTGSADLFDGTAIVVKPNQCAILIYKGQIADVLLSGTHFAKTENIPLITQLANWKFGLESPLRCEIWFFSGNVFTSRRWGTSQPVVVPIANVGATPIRAYGNYNLVVTDPQRVFLNLIGSRTTFDVTDLEDFVQGQLLELLPMVLNDLIALDELASRQQELSKKLESLINRELAEFGIRVQKIQILSLLPPTDVLKALDDRLAMKVIGNQKEYLMYKAANSLDGAGAGGTSESMQMMLGLMLGKGIMNTETLERENPQVATVEAKSFCSNCGSAISLSHKFCSNCGTKS